VDLPTIWILRPKNSTSNPGIESRGIWPGSRDLHH
jgi:hypothetical protein